MLQRLAAGRARVHSLQQGAGTRSVSIPLLLVLHEVSRSVHETPGDDEALIPLEGGKELAFSELVAYNTPWALDEIC